MAVDLGAELQRLARRMRAGRPRVQHRAAVAQARDALAVEQVRVDARHLRRGVGAHAERAAAELVDQLEGLQVEFAAGARQQRLQVLEQRRHHQLAAVAARHVEQAAAQFLDAPGLGGQHIGDVLGQQPSRRHEERTGGLKRRLYRPRSARPHARASAQGQKNSSITRPASMLLRPRKRIWPSLSCVARSNTRRQVAGLKNGSRPSITSISATARRAPGRARRRARRRSTCAAGAAGGAAPGAAAHGPEEVAARVDHHHVGLAAEARAVGLEAAIELRELRIAAERIGEQRRSPSHRPRP